MELIERWKVAKARYELAKDELDSLRDELIETFGANFRGGGIEIRESIRVGSLDTSAIESVLGCSVNVYRKPGRKVISVQLSRRASAHMSLSDTLFIK